MKSKQIAVIIGKRIKEARQARGLTQNYIAQLIDRSDAHISWIESGKSAPSIDDAFMICLILGIDIQSILPSMDEIGGDADGVVGEIIERSKKRQRLAELEKEREALLAELG